MISLLNSASGRRYALISLLLFAIVGLSVVRVRQNTTSRCATHKDTYKVVEFRARDTTYKVLLADTPARWEYGLMNIKNKKDICGYEGMLFTFPLTMPQTFWNKNTLVDLKLYWVKDDHVLSTSDLPSITKSKRIVTASSVEPVDTVIEIIK